ncbi:MAG: hypothetical protein ACMG6E_03900, partial [Candidatus Roizmanbacteria bacterium]
VMLPADRAEIIKKISISDIHIEGKKIIDFSHAHFGLFGKISKKDQEFFQRTFSKRLKKIRLSLYMS